MCIRDRLLAPLGQPWAVESHLSAQQLHQGGQAQDEDKTLVRLQLALKEAIAEQVQMAEELSLIHISEPTRLLSISYAVFCLKKKKKKEMTKTYLHQAYISII
eukprot:TRINITY_DN2219_c0_g1_i3.p1 TRINITY_DN2219_c0_g1~~TRINITY_DN2219_c0_g1_i3.p1  ORF type:complete len:103 (-),score=37.13 TRINITY_DN2219_c0_g1_i3:7-315(-)